MKEALDKIKVAEDQAAKIVLDASKKVKDILNEATNKAQLIYSEKN